MVSVYADPPLVQGLADREYSRRLRATLQPTGAGEATSLPNVKASSKTE